LARAEQAELGHIRLEYGIEVFEGKPGSHYYYREERDIISD
jgi:hypothetical protein